MESTANIENTNINQKIMVYKEIANKWAADGDYEAALRTIEYYLHYLPVRQQIFILEDLSRIYCHFHGEENAIAIASKIEDEEWRKQVMTGIALARSSDVPLEGALKIYANYEKSLYDPEYFLNPIEHLYSGDEYVRIIIKRYPDWESEMSGDSEKQSEGYIHFLSSVKMFLSAENGDLIGILGSLVTDVFKEHHEEDELRKAMLGYFDKGYIKIYLENNNPLSLQEEILQFCKNHEEVGRKIIPPIARNLAQRREYKAIDAYRLYLSSDDLLEIAAIAASSGDDNFVRLTINPFNKQKIGECTEQQLESLVTALSQIGDFQEAEEFSMQAPDLKKRASLLLIVEKAIFERGNREKAADTLGRILKEINPKQITNQPDIAFKKVVLGYSKQGNLPEAKNAISYIRDEKVKRDAYSEIAINLARADDVQAALSIYDEIGSMQQSPATIDQICFDLCRSHRCQEFLEIAQKYRNNSAVYKTLITMGVECLAVGDIGMCSDRIWEAFKVAI